MKNIKVVIVGAGELGRQAAHYMTMMKPKNYVYSHVGWIDDTYKRGDEINGIPVVGMTNEILSLYNEGVYDACFVAIGYNHLEYKYKLIQQLKNSIQLINIIATNVFIDPSAILGVNVFIYPGVIVDKGVRLKDGCLLNLGSIIAHDSEIGESTFLAPNVTIAGFSKIGKCAFLGINSCVIDNIIINDKVRLGAGTTVTCNIDKVGIYCGTPAKFKHF